MKTQKPKIQRYAWSIVALCVLGFTATFAQTPVQKNGKLSVCGTKLCNQYGFPIQLRGMSTHGIQWYGWGSCLTEASLNALANDWGADILRISMYVQEGGYETNPTAFTNQVITLVNEATERGMYALIDFHQLDPGDPNYNTTRAKTFFTAVANAFKDYNNVIYDICNEPNGVGWNTIRNYATQVIPVIRAIDSDAVVLVGTHGWSTFGVSGDGTLQDVVNNPLPYSNVMYTFHFYAASHGQAYIDMLDDASDVLPVFVTEFGSQTASGDGTNNFTRTQQYIDLMRTKKISWCNWNYSDDFRSGAVWLEGTCSAGPWTVSRLKPAGAWIRDRILSPADDFPGGGNVAPTVNITAPANGAVFTAPASITINANAADADGSVTKVEFFQGTTKLGEDLTSPYSFTWSGVATGSYALTAKATDNGSATTTSAAVNVTVQSAPGCQPVSASADDGNVPANVLDNNLSTRWSANGDGQWIQFCLATQQTVNGVSIAFYNGNTRTSSFDILTSLDGTTWSAALTNRTSSGTTLNQETFSFSQRAAKYVRIVGHGNSVNLWNSYTEVDILTVTAPACEPVTASGDDGNVAANVLDNNTATRWSASGEGQWIQFCLNTTSTVSGVQIAFYKGTERRSIFDVLVSTDAASWSTVATGLQSSGTSLALETFSFSPVTAKYVRIVGHGNTLNAWNSYTEVRITTAASALRAMETGQSVSSENVVSSYPNPARDQVTISYKITEAGRVHLSLYDMSNGRTTALIDAHQEAGHHQTIVDTRSLSRGLHVIRLIHQGKVHIEKLAKQ
ncbi:cellulase family glycosylhydrolase [Fulvivirgaceae bacterium PWU4]|uniref:Cellulase family glycosylhydrolase n=1 Tax=Chryseosolibacter histidini TaxID=2782349 RepID=A0AAP2DGI4_9BACT|nr:cellulase family glycosylhydrolase [Chryseosolibacter histidini]MBT1695885.1 cellulase family glycosylhydrolase [Chryseosolibacter histidini]